MAPKLVQIYCPSVLGNTSSRIVFNSEWKLSDLKKEINSVCNGKLPIHQQQVIFSGRILEMDDAKLSEILPNNLTEYTVFVVPRFSDLHFVDAKPFDIFTQMDHWRLLSNWYTLNYLLYVQRFYQSPTSNSEVGGTDSPAVDIANVEPQAEAAHAEPVRVAPEQVMNAQGGLDDEDLGEGIDRDWLDWLYVVSRFGLLLAILYFYSSFHRFVLLVLVIALFWAYERGFFGRRGNVLHQRRRQQLQQQAEADAVPVAQDLNAADIERPAVDNDAEQILQPPAEDIVAGMPNGIRPIEQLTPWQVFCQTCYVFITSFFTSLIPQRQPHPNAN